MLLRARQRTIAFPRARPLVMGIVNLSPDSFSGDASPDLDAAFAAAARMLTEGADIIDIGGESARANRPPVPAEEETARLLPFVAGFADRVAAAFPSAPFDADQLWPPLLSLNTWRPEVVSALLPAGGDLLNDIGALPTPANAALCAGHGAALLIMHSVGNPKEPHLDQRYEDIWSALETFFAEKIALAETAGLARDRVLLDPGIDFAKQREDNLRIFAGLARLHRFARPVLLPVSRKTVIGDVLGIEDAATRDAGTIACAVAGFLRGAHVLRVHNVAATARALKVLAAVEGA